MVAIVKVPEKFTLLLRDAADEYRLGNTIWVVDPLLQIVPVGTYVSTQEEGTEEVTYYFGQLLLPALTEGEMVALQSAGYITFEIERSSR